MLGHIIRKEISANLSSPTFLGTFAFCFALILLSLYTGLRSYRDQVLEHGLTQTINRENLAQQTNYGMIANTGVQLSKPPEVLGVMVSGLENSMGRHIPLNKFTNPALTGSKIEGNPIFAVFGDLDLMFIVKTVLSLLAILFTYNALSGEKEDGTLRLTLSHPVPRDSLILGKMIGGFLCLVIPLSIPLLLGIALLTVFPDIRISGGDWVRMGFILGVFLLYLALFFTMGMLVSARTTRSSVSFLILLFVWVVCVLVIPKGSVILAGQFVPVPSLQEHRMRMMQTTMDLYRKFSTDQRKFFTEAPPKAPELPPDTPKEKRDAAMAEFRQTRTDWMNRRQNRMKEMFDNLQAQREVETAKLERAYQTRQQRLADLAVVLSRISPASAMTYASMNLAGTGIEGHDQFLAMARSYKEKFVEYVDRKVKESGGGMGGIVFSTGPTQKPETPVDTRDMPAFRYQREPVSDTLGRVAVDLALMGLLTVVFFAGAYVSFLKYDVR